jgi:hypothetical protein
MPSGDTEMLVQGFFDARYITEQQGGGENRKSCMFIIALKVV